MKVLFLDFDGVLNSFSSAYYNRAIGLKSGLAPLDSTLVSFLNEIIARVPNCKIVISSSWRIGRTVEELRTELTDKGFDYPDCVIDKTGWADRRDDEILNWIKEQDEEVVYCVLDDDSFDLTAVQDRLVHTDIRWGLTRYDVDKCVVMFGERSVNKCAVY